MTGELSAYTLGPAPRFCPSADFQRMQAGCGLGGPQFEKAVSTPPLYATMAMTGELPAYTLGPAPRFCPSGLQSLMQAGCGLGGPCTQSKEV